MDVIMTSFENMLRVRRESLMNCGDACLACGMPVVY
jgi:hypothetical protein